MITITIVIISFLLIASGFCSAIETAFTAASPAKIHKIKISGNIFAKQSLLLLKIKDKVISTFLIIYSIFNTFATTIATSLFISIYGEGEGAFISSLVMASLIIIFAEVIPKAIAVAKPETIVIFFSSFVKTCLFIMNPINISLGYIVKLFCFIFKINLTQNVSVVDEVKGIVQHYHAEGNVLKIDRDMIGGVLDISNMSIENVMIHRSKIDSISQDLPLQTIVQEAMKAKHSKLPIWKDNPENIIGVLDTKKLLLQLYGNDFSFMKLDLSTAISEPWFVPETVLVNKQLQDFKNRADKIAFIINEYGELQGMVTLKDIIDEIVGHFNEESHLHSVAINQLGSGYLIEGVTTVRQINRELDWNLPEDDANTIAGLIINKIGRIPETGDELGIFDLRITIQKKIDNKIITILAQK